MDNINEYIIYIVLFISLYFEVFLLLNFFEIKDKSKKVINNTYDLVKSPTVSVIVPVWNEEKTILKTIFSILKLNYPKDKLSVFIVDDGSTDNTWKIIQRFKNNKQIKLLRKENGGKHTALNFALKHIDSELVGCLDADSYVHPEALKRIVREFENREIMAVTPSIVLYEPRGILQLVQKAEYMFGIFLRKVFSHLNAIYITPGPFSIFRRKVFDLVGEYRHAHSTEDMEMAMRMQKNGMKIGNVSNAYVYTVGPKSLKSLYKQRLRWVYGFLKNTIDYRDMFFRPQYGHLGMVVLPAAGFSVVSTMYFFGSMIINFLNSIFKKIEEIRTIGLNFNGFNFDLFYFNLDIIILVSIFAIIGTLYIIFNSRILAGEKNKFGLDSILFLALYAFIAPIWMSRAIYNVVFSRKTNWR